MGVFKSPEILFAHNLICSYPIVLTVCTEYGSNTAMLCAKLQNDLTNAMNVMDEQDFTIIVFITSFGGISYIATALWIQYS